MQLGKTVTMELLLSPSSSVEELRRQITEAGEKEGAQDIPTANRMEARLTGRGFEIAAISPDVQAISGGETTKWRWDITPTQTDEKEVHLTINALIAVDAWTTPRFIRSYDRTTKVSVTWGQRVAGFVGNNWQWLWTRSSCR